LIFYKNFLSPLILIISSKPSEERTYNISVRLLIYYVDIAKITPAVNWPGLAYSAQQLLKTRGGAVMYYTTTTNFIW